MKASKQAKKLVRFTVNESGGINKNTFSALSKERIKHEATTFTETKLSYKNDI